MFNVTAEPIANVAPYKRISINDPAQVEPEPRYGVSPVYAAILIAERERIWALVKGAAEGTNITAREYEAPTEDAA